MTSLPAVEGCLYGLLSRYSCLQNLMTIAPPKLLYSFVLLFFLCFNVSKNENRITMTNLIYAVKPYYYVYHKLF